MNDTEYMRLALELAKKGCGWTSPNPMVGAVIVKDGQIIGQGWHERYGQPHAERNALASCAVDPEGATMYVTLEPCCHFGKQPPCVNAILEAGISRVVVGSADPNPLVSGKGIAALRVQGVAVTEGVLREECDALNRIFFHFITTKRPFVSMKYAMTMDGKIARLFSAGTGSLPQPYPHAECSVRWRGYEHRARRAGLRQNRGTDADFSSCRTGSAAEKPHEPAHAGRKTGGGGIFAHPQQLLGQYELYCCPANKRRYVDYRSGASRQPARV